MCCHNKSGCEHPERKQDKAECTPEQIQECHGDVETHPNECTPERIEECHGEVEAHPCDSTR